MDNYDILAPVENFDDIKKSAKEAASELVELAGLQRGDIFVVGCSSSEVIGEKIGNHSAFDAAKAVFEGVYSVLNEKGISMNKWFIGPIFNVSF